MMGRGWLQRDRVDLGLGPGSSRPSNGPPSDPGADRHEAGPQADLTLSSLKTLIDSGSIESRRFAVVAVEPA